MGFLSASEAIERVSRIHLALSAGLHQSRTMVTDTKWPVVQN
jgi:hypothetical protein